MRRETPFDVARFFVTRRVSEENLILLRSSLTRRVSIFPMSQPKAQLQK
jgi:hypothetical protein